MCRVIRVHIIKLVFHSTNAFLVCFLTYEYFSLYQSRRAISKQYCEIHITMANAADVEREQMCWAKAWEVVLESQEPG